ncbi:diaminopropionate ammonia-lyase [Flavobacteriaceae bacterium]|jgi:diaminopropionate ammonia-lyase|nr:diaminopropionate ammonia-lyase [Flavobacteriaceae bacterium]MDA9127013.1 diaminopropionate ammonia-lyase [Flavobacteriaceae bacterium]MDA9240809.1 diaminopropionate ammonia-lyase [Flavobacteriaceae bacterium]MDA9319012.1 diaminopropionate ammonia-lyase [Flavobacteriaceae bacterium]MDA9362072.1 diaminopropionate ammonia-lyase [Flavobacteriaceae bacterium]|tara:strand:+ start:8590 stop:9699 length:1110 start_codon:yes stop_codon:yes gene_type:complete
MNDFIINNCSNTLDNNLSNSILKLSNSYDFHTKQDYYNKTPLVNLDSLSNHLGLKNIFVKDESNRFGLNSFKVLGSTYAIHEILKKNPNIGVFCTATDGNHGKGIAWSAKKYNKKAIIYVPRDTSINRIKAIESYNADVYQLDLNYEETCIYASQKCDDNGWCLIQDASWENYEEIPSYIMSGYLTHFKEIEIPSKTDLQSKFDVIFLQCGVGSWASSGIWYYLNNYKGVRPKIVLVEPEEACGVFESFENGKRISPNTSFNTIMAGLNCGIPSKNAWEIIKNGCDAVIKISDSDVRTAMRQFYYPLGNDSQIISGESGAAGLTGLIKVLGFEKSNDLKKFLNLNNDSKILLFNTEGNTDPENFQNIIS